MNVGCLARYTYIGRALPLYWTESETLMIVSEEAPKSYIIIIIIGPQEAPALGGFVRL